MNAAGKQHSANDRLAMCDRIGAKVEAYKCSRTDGSTSTDLRGLDVSSFITSAADMGASKYSICPSGVQASTEDWSTGLEQTCGDGLTDTRQFVDKKLAETTR